MSKRDILCDMGYEDSTVFDNPDYDSAIIGVSDDGNVIYDYDLMVQWHIENDGMTADEAAEFIDYNAIRALPYAKEPKPIVMTRLEEWNMEKERNIAVCTTDCAFDNSVCCRDCDRNGICPEVCDGLEGQGYEKPCDWRDE